VKFAWKPSPYDALWPAAELPIGKALQSEEFAGKKYTSYVTYTVTLTFQGKSRTYNSWMLFGRDDKGNPQVYFMDTIADPTAVTFAYEHSLYPSAFVDTDLRTVPFIDKWLYDNALACHPKHNAQDDRVDVCCDPKAGRCGVAESTLALRPRSKTLPPAYIVPASFHISSVPVNSMVLQSVALKCSTFNVSTTFPHGLGDVQEHNDGQHNFTATVAGSFAYTDGSTVPGPCNVQCSAQSSSVTNEFGSLQGLVFVHATAKTDSSGGDFANGGSAAISCLGLSGGTVKSCTFPCSTSISITAGGKGNLGATISFPTNQLWSDQNQGQLSCQPQDSSVDPTSGCDTTDQQFTRNGTVVCEPLIVDLTGEGFHLTDQEHGVVFDIAATNRPFKIPWTADSRNAFLVLDRNGNGIIDNGWEMFGNFTPQQPSDTPNGFLALAMYDRPEYGGNGDGVIDQRDLIFSQLRLWVDSNHDGISQPGELHTLPELGGYSISLKYQLSRKTDEFGNVFRYRAKLNPDKTNDSSEVGRQIYDVFFVTK
jgi:hypothetical protein